MEYRIFISIIDIPENWENIDISKAILKDIDIDKAILENIDVDRTVLGNSLLYFLNTPLCVKVNCNETLQLTFTQFGVKINSKQNGVNFYTKWCNTRLLVATANIAEATACLVTRRSLHGPGSNFCHPPAHGVEICFV